MRPGVQTCKKCKLQKTITKVAHKYETKTVTETTYPACEDCGMVFDPCDYGTFEYIDDRHFTAKSYDAAYEAAFDACDDHRYECVGYENMHDETNLGITHNWFITQLMDYDHPYKETRKETKCKYCGLYKEWIEKVFTGE